MRWTKELDDKLIELAGNTPVQEIARQLDVTYFQIANRLRELNVTGGKTPPKRKRPTGKYVKSHIKRHLQDYDYRPNGWTLAQYARANQLKLEPFVHAIKTHFPDWWYAFTQTEPDQISRCDECDDEYIKNRSDQMYCSATCATRARADMEYFGGERGNTVGLASKTCQICGRITDRGLSSHHVFGKKNDDENRYLVALCSGCHDTLTYLAARPWVNDPSIWENLIAMCLYRSVDDQYQDWSDEAGFDVSVEIRFQP